MDEKLRRQVQFLVADDPEPVLVQLLLLDDIRRTLVQLLEIEQEEREEGLTWAIPAFVLAAATRIDVQEGERDIRLFGLVVVNDGVGSIDIGINSRDRGVSRLNANETYRITYTRGIITQIYLTPVAGATPTVRLTGTY